MNKNLKATLAVLCGNVIFGFSFLFSRLALNVTEPTVLIAIRFLTAFILLNIMIPIGRKLKKKSGKPLITFSLKGKPRKNILLLAIFQPILYFISENYGISLTSSAFAGVIIALIPLAGILCDVLIMHRSVTKLQVICSAASVIGVFLTSIGAQDMHSSLTGLILLLIAVLSGSLFYVYSKRASSDYSPLERTYVMFGCGAFVYTIAAVIRCAAVGTDIITAAAGSSIFWLSIGYLSCISSILAFLLLNYGSETVSVSRATLFANVTTVISIFAGVVILHERFTPIQFIGAVIIIGGVYFAQISPISED